MYGKPPMASANVGGWRQQHGAHAEERKRSSGGRSFAGSRFSNKFRPPLDFTVMGRLIPGQYKVQSAVELEKNKYGVTTVTLPYYECAEHYDGRTGRSTLCSAGPVFFRKEFAQPCVGCRGFYAAPKDGEGRRKGRFNRHTLFIFTWLEYGAFCKVEQVDTNGLVKLSPKGTPYTEWIRKFPGIQGVLEEKEGHTQHWPMGQQHLDAILAYDSAIGRTCNSCKAPDAVTRRALLCSNQACGEDIIDCHTSSVLVKDQDKMLYTDVECPRCHTKAPLVEYIECKCCGTPTRSSVFDVDVNVQRMEGAGNNQLIFTSWSQPHPIDASYKAKPLDLMAMYTPETLEKQEERFGMSYEEAEVLGAAEFQDPRR